MKVKPEKYTDMSLAIRLDQNRAIWYIPDNQNEPIKCIWFETSSANISRKVFWFGTSSRIEFYRFGHSLQESEMNTISLILLFRTYINYILNNKKK